MLTDLFSNLVDFLFPKSLRVREIESLSPAQFRQSAEIGTGAIFKYHNNLVRDALWELKYRKNREIAEIFGHIILEEISKLPPDEMIVTFVPARAHREAEKGFDQGLFLLETMERLYKNNLINTKLKFIPNILTHTRVTTQQSKTKNRTERFTNMDHAFICMHRELVQGKIILILDDISTTGATLQDASRALADSGASHIYSIAIAH